MDLSGNSRKFLFVDYINCCAPLKASAPIIGLNNIHLLAIIINLPQTSSESEYNRIIIMHRHYEIIIHSKKTKSELYYYSEKCCPCTYCPAGSTAARQLERVHISRFFFLGLRRGGWCMRRMVSKNPRFHHMKTTHLDVYWLDGLYIHPVRSFYFLFVASHQSFSEPNYLIRRISTFPRTL
jgi:hypothetical protein